MKAPELSAWAGRLVSAFSLSFPAPRVAVRRLRKGILGKIVDREELDIHGSVAAGPPWYALAVLARGLLDLQDWQDFDRAPRQYRCADMRERAASMGLVVDRKGRIELADGESAFRRLLEEHRVDLDGGRGLVVQERAGRSKMALWTCSCTPPVKLRVGRSEVWVSCRFCGADFRKVG